MGMRKRQHTLRSHNTVGIRYDDPILPPNIQITTTTYDAKFVSKEKSFYEDIKDKDAPYDRGYKMGYRDFVNAAPSCVESLVYGPLRDGYIMGYADAEGDIDRPF